MYRPTRTSYSALSTYEACPLSYKLYYLDKHETPVGAAANRGTRLHLAMEKYFLGNLPENKLPIEFSKIKTELIVMKTLNAMPEQTWLVTDDWTYQEEEDENTRFKAIVDVHYLIDDVLFIFDLKTGREYPEHAEQLAAYAACGQARYPHVNKIIAAPLYLEGMGKQDGYTKQLIPYIQQDWKARWDKLFAEAEWLATPSPAACRFCDYVKMGLCDSPWGRK